MPVPHWRLRVIGATYMVAKELFLHAAEFVLIAGLANNISKADIA